MPKFLENKLSMYEAVRSFLKANGDKLAGIPALVSATGDFDTVVEQIKAKGLEVDNSTSGKAQKKADAEEALVDSLLPVSAALLALASVNKDPELKAKVAASESQLRKMRDTDLAKKAEGIRQAGTANLSAAADFGLTQEMLADLDSRIKTFNVALGDRESSVGQRVGAKSAMIELYGVADEILSGRLDNLITLLRKKEPQLCEEYNSTRVIRDVGLRHKPVASPQEQTAAGTEQSQAK